MASSDDEGEMVPKNVSDYEFLSDNEGSVSFSKLCIEWDGSGTHDEKRKAIFLSGKTDSGLLKIYKEVVAWKFELPRGGPEISVLSIEGSWIKLLKPRKAFQDIIRTIQITLHFLHFVKWNPHQSEKALWEYLNKTFSMFERRPCEDDLAVHMPFINEAVKRDETLANSKLLSTFLKEKPRKKKNFNEDVNPPFIVDDVDGDEGLEEFLDIHESDDAESDVDDCFDSVCAICDNGGHIYICEGQCMRSFHATLEDGEESNCESLGFGEEDLEAIKNLPFYCKNCQYKQQQCFACGELGSSDESSGAEVFCCVNGACGYFYHPSCVAKLLHADDRAAAEEHQKRIAAGETFACPAHKCHVCKELEVRTNRDLQFAVCRRCPRSYHRKCLPRDIAFEENVDKEGVILQRAWEGLIPNRILIYCLKHEIDPEIATPVRDHIKFPGPKHDQKKSLSLQQSSIKKDLKKGRGLVSEDNAGKRILSKSAVKLSSSSKQGDCSRKNMEKLPVMESSKNVKVAAYRNSLGKSKASTNGKGQISLGDRLYATFYGMDSESDKSSSGANGHGDQERTQKVKPIANRTNAPVTLDADSQQRILALMKDASSSLTLDQVRQKHKSPSTHSQSSKFYADNITMGKVEGTIQSVRAALQKLDEGGSVEDAKAVCGKDLLIQVLKWKEKFKVFLAPFLYGMRYTSFGRHFTKMDKLKEVVDILHWYIQDNDMLVDFCCGSNDFSCLVKQKVDEMGKRCSFKNYDILQAKNDFCFERRDWMGVRRNELPNGSQLIMGLNPPFGVNAALANKFVNKALEFNPKLIILIVPRETQRLDEKDSPYDLVWQDDQMFVGKSFYLPGSVDANDKQIEDWNVSAPILYLWSRPDWTPKHKAIAEQHGHFPGMRKKKSHDEMQVLKSSQDPENPTDSIVPKVEDLWPVKSETDDQKGKASTSHPDGLPQDSNGVKGDKSCTPGKKRIEGNSKSRGKRAKRRRLNNNSPEDNSHAKRSASRDPSSTIPRHGLFEAYSPRHNEIPSQVPSRRDSYHQFDQRNFSMYPQEVDGMMRTRTYTLNSEEPFPTTTSRHAPDPSPKPEYGLRASTERWVRPEERGNSLHHYGLYMGEGSVRYGGRDGRMEPHSWNQQGIHPQPYPGHGFPSHPGQVHPPLDSTYGGMNTASTMQRYASRLGMDELNYSPMGGMVSRPPVHDMSGMFRPPGPRPMYPSGSLGFAAAPRGPYSHHNSAGWLND